MNAFALALAYLRARALNTALNVLLLSLGIATICVLLLVSHQLGDRMLRDGRGIDLVVGAKGSPVQLILSAVYQVDFPTGNIPLAEAERLRAHPTVREAIPLALGDSFQGQRIVGTEHAYAAHYGASIAEGRLWQAPFEATLGARAAATTGLRVGDRFFGAHGLAGGDHLHVHDAFPYEVVGVLAPTGTVIDRLILTPVETVWAVHEHGDAPHVDEPLVDAVAMHEDEHEHEHEDDHAADAHQITALLIKYATPLAAVSLPREINDGTAMQAASPAMETARLLS
ncbi:MAG: ABC transporter permease, partial [Chromatiales bacterium]|nr:ABC transporter permease [Chromatiales bacterium]